MIAEQSEFFAAGLDKIRTIAAAVAVRSIARESAANH
jgi:hypothetical protein